MSLKRSVAPAIVGAALIALGGCSTAADPGPEPSDTGAAEGPEGAAPDSVEAACAAAVEEGNLTVWASEDTDVYQKIVGRFTEKYPGIKVSTEELREDDVVQRLTAEASAGKAPEVDAVTLTVDSSISLADQNLIDTAVDWEKLGVAPERIVGGMARETRVPIALAYNPDVTDPADLPDTWEELIDPQWSGKVVVDPRGDQIKLLATVWGVDETIDYTRRLAETTSPQVIQGGTAGMLTVISGENIISTNGRVDEIRIQASNGAPVAAHYLDIVPAVDYFIAVVQDAPNPNAALCYGAWLASDEGTEAEREFALADNVDVPEEAADAEIAMMAGVEDAQTVAEAAAAIQDVWAGRQ